jgi:fluoride exporter
MSRIYRDLEAAAGAQDGFHGGSMTTYLWIAVGSGLGGMARYASGGLITAQLGTVLPWGTLSINVLGSFLIGLVAAVTGPEGRWPVAPDVQRFLTVGFLGGFTTFSAFSLETLQLIRDGAVVRAGAYVSLSVALCLVAVAVGFGAGSAFYRNA